MRTRLGISAEDVSEPFSKFSRRASERSREVAASVRSDDERYKLLLGHLETSIRGNIRFVVLPDLASDLLLDFGLRCVERLRKHLTKNY